MVAFSSIGAGVTQKHEKKTDTEDLQCVELYSHAHASDKVSNLLSANVFNLPEPTVNL